MNSNIEYAVMQARLMAEADRILTETEVKQLCTFYDISENEATRFEHLIPIRKQVLSLRCGFFGEQYSTEEIAEAYQISCGRVLQIESLALRQLKDLHHRRTKPLKDTFKNETASGSVAFIPEGEK